MHKISDHHLRVKDVKKIVYSDTKIELSASSIEKIVKCRKYLDDKMEGSDKLFYGINTGFGSLCNIAISNSETSQLQYNLVVSHACGTGKEISSEIVKIMLFLKIQSLSFGHSGVALETVERLIEMYNNDIIPIIYEFGSLGASGDLAPLAHMSLPLLGLGEVYYQGEKISGETLLIKMNWKPLRLQSKEGLALLNGTQFMSSFGTYLLIKAKELVKQLNKVACLSLEAYDCRPEPFNKLVHIVRPHKGQIKAAERVLQTLKGSEIFNQEKAAVQDPYSFRCIPQVHGASKGVFNQVEETITTEINSVTDNPNIFPDEDMIISGGNFHGQPLAMALDYLCIALAELGSISERRTYKMLSGTRNLPTFLVKNSGLNSGLMIPQYTSASIVSKNKQLCTPSSVDTISSSNGQEDHVSMGANSATKCFTVLENLQRIIAIELLTGAQAFEFRRPLKSSTIIEEFYTDYRKEVSFIEEDRVLHWDIEKSFAFLFKN
tara:strand:- start:2772 stop:4247 length:1476 start_codon:yes stop_codon:yes gene_type:complete